MGFFKNNVGFIYFKWFNLVFVYDMVIWCIDIIKLNIVVMFE